MKQFNTIYQLQDYLAEQRQLSAKIALVPTMGNLHEGHLQLVERAKDFADIVVVSIFVNPAQFGMGEDFESYPRTLERDLQMLAGRCEVVFAPPIDQMYPIYPQDVQMLLAGQISQILCASSRPTHFDGVLLVLTKLFNIVRPDVALFGKKDYQQLTIIRKLNAELHFGIKIVGVDIVRDQYGLALSSRNNYLSADEKIQARLLNQTLQAIKSEILAAPAHPNNYYAIVVRYRQQLSNWGLKVDYLKIYNDRLVPITANDKNLVVLMAVFVGRARLLDNIEIDLP